MPLAHCCRNALFTTTPYSSIGYTYFHLFRYHEYGLIAYRKPQTIRQLRSLPLELLGCCSSRILACEHLPVGIAIASLPQHWTKGTCAERRQLLSCSETEIDTLLGRSFQHTLFYRVYCQEVYSIVLKCTQNKIRKYKVKMHWA